MLNCGTLIIFYDPLINMYSFRVAISCLENLYLIRILPCCIFHPNHLIGNFKTMEYFITIFFWLADVIRLFWLPWYIRHCIYLDPPILINRFQSIKLRNLFFEGSAFVLRCSPRLCSWTTTIYSVYHTTKLTYSQPQLRPSFICRWHSSLHIFIYSRNWSFP